MQHLEALVLAIVLGSAIELARPVLMAVVQGLSRWWLNPNHASPREYDVYFNREYVLKRSSAKDDTHPPAAGPRDGAAIAG